MLSSWQRSAGNTQTLIESDGFHSAQRHWPVPVAGEMTSIANQIEALGNLGKVFVAECVLGTSVHL